MNKMFGIPTKPSSDNTVSKQLRLSYLAPFHPKYLVKVKTPTAKNRTPMFNTEGKTMKKNGPPISRGFRSIRDISLSSL